MINGIEQKDVITITKESPDYPTAWKKLKGAPETLYCVGDTSLLQTRTLCVVGSRRTQESVIKLGMQLSKDLSYAFTLVTGTADGGDSAVLEGALLGSGRVICVLAGGFSDLPQTNLPLLKRVLKSGLILSVHPYETQIRAYSYEYRNKLLARLSEGTLVLSAGEKSGALITAKYATQQNKPVFALPYFPQTPSGVGCNALIKGGAKLVESARDILEHFGLKQMQVKEEKPLNEREQTLLQTLKEEGTLHVAELSEKTGMPLFKVKATLSSLEVKGMVASVGANRYAPV